MSISLSTVVEGIDDLHSVALPASVSGVRHRTQRLGEKCSIPLTAIGPVGRVGVDEAAVGGGIVSFEIGMVIPDNYRSRSQTHWR